MKEERIVRGNIALAKLMGYRLERDEYLTDNGGLKVRWKLYQGDILQQSTPEGWYDDMETAMWNFVGKTVEYHNDWNKLMRVWFHAREICVKDSKFGCIVFSMNAGSVDINLRSRKYGAFEFSWEGKEEHGEETFRKVMWIACVRFARFYGKKAEKWNKMLEQRKAE